ncbi:MAG: hypothetical protein HRT77_14415 [Halioglobus sp.]|nr:hypothetical protein [Halioglobus sp.]
MPDETRAAAAEMNIRRLLKSLDVKPKTKTITIPVQVHSTAVLSNALAAPSIAFLDFTDNATFTSSASQLLAILTSDYPFTAVLVDATDLTKTHNRLPAL